MFILPIVYNHQNELAADKTLYDQIISWLAVGMLSAAMSISSNYDLECPPD